MILFTHYRYNSSFIEMIYHYLEYTNIKIIKLFYTYAPPPIKILNTMGQGPMCLMDEARMEDLDLDYIPDRISSR